MAYYGQPQQQYGQYQGHPQQQQTATYYQPQYASGTPGVNPEVQQWFNAVDADRSGRITAEELQAALVNSNGARFSYECCRLMLGMFDPQKTGTIDVLGFQHLFKYVNDWLTTFRSFDRNNSGTIDKAELNQALQQMGYRFSPQFVESLVLKYDPKTRNTMTVDQFILALMTIQRVTETFRARDQQMQGVINISYEDFLQTVFTCTS